MLVQVLPPSVVRQMSGTSASSSGGQGRAALGGDAAGDVGGIDVIASFDRVEAECGAARRRCC